jgi:hypothetical protein
MTTELQALQNFGDILGLKIHEKYSEDKRKTIKKYFASLEGVSVSPVLDYEQLNCFMIGWNNRETKGKFINQ